MADYDTEAAGKLISCEIYASAAAREAAISRGVQYLSFHALATKIADSHAMAPVGPWQGDLRDLAAYINSLH